MKSHAHIVCVATARLEKGFPVAPEAGLGPGRAAFQQTNIKRGRCVHFGVWKLPVWIEHHWWLIHLSDLYCRTHALNLISVPAPPPPSHFLKHDLVMSLLGSQLCSVSCLSTLMFVKFQSLREMRKDTLLWTPKILGELDQSTGDRFLFLRN